MITSRQIWKEVLEGSVQEAIELTRAHRMSPGDGPVKPGLSADPHALFIEPSLNSSAGHQLKLADCYRRLLCGIGYRTIVIHGRKTKMVAQQDWHPYFLVQHHTMSFRAIKSPQELERVESYFSAEFEDIIELYSPRVCVFGTIRFTNIVAAALAVTRNRSREITHAIFGVLEGCEAPDCDIPEIVRSAFSRAADIFRNSSVKHMLVVETEHVRDFLLDCGFSQESVKVYQYVAAKNKSDVVAASENKSDDVRIGYMGGTRKVRNPELIADLLVSEEIPESTHWIVQMNENYLNKVRGQKVIQRLQAMHEAGVITLHSTGLDDELYWELFASLDFVVLPYSERYQQIGSGMLIEAINLEVIPILPKVSSMSSLYLSLGGNAPSFEELSPVAIKAAIADGMSRLTNLKKEAVTVRKRWSQHPSANAQWQADLTNWLTRGKKEE